ncbi:MAG TPA: AraC family transcriptional regulator [Flavobacteriales bacterium]
MSILHERRIVSIERPCTMPTSPIPLHDLAADGHGVIGVERIRPAQGPVRNGVHRHAYHELFFFTEGSGTHMIDLHTHAWTGPSMHVVGPGQVHQLHRSAGTQGVVVMFGTEALLDPLRLHAVNQLFSSGGPCSALDSPLSSGVLPLVELLEKELQQGGATEEMLFGYLSIILLKCVEGRKGTAAASGSDANDPVQRFTRALEEQFLDKRQVSAYADDLAVTPGHLNELVRKRLGKSASEVVQDRLLLEAKRLLLHSDRSVKEVSYALRMDDPAYFNRMFKKATGMTPVEYRTHIREKYKG